MRGLFYQLKNMRRDKLCILTFFLPIAAGIAISLLSGHGTQSLGELSFGYVQDELSGECVTWLCGYGSVTCYSTDDELRAAVNNPSTPMIGVYGTGNGIRTILSGDEFELYKTAGELLPQLYGNRSAAAAVQTTIVPVPADDGLRSLLIAITLITAMFMGCTFNAMNIIGEKEDGVDLINQILPMTTKNYVAQKLLLGFTGGASAAILTALLCIRVTPGQIIPLCLLMLLSAFLASLTGLFIGHFASGMMTGIVYIKIVMILFLAPPVVFWLLVPPDSAVWPFTYLLPSGVTFYGLMDLLNGQTERMWMYLGILSVHVVLWSGGYAALRSASGSGRVPR